MKVPLAILAVPLLLGVAGDQPVPELEKPVRLEAAGKPVDTEIGHAAPLVIDWDGDGWQDLLVGQFGGGLLRIYRSEGGMPAPRLAAGVPFKAAGADGTVPTG